jgi:enoyl-CoA hydratase
VIEIQRGPGVETWRLNAPPVNGLGPELVGRLTTEVHRVDGDETVCIVILTSALGVFSAGADAKWVAKTAKEVGREHLVDAFQRTMDELRKTCFAMRQSGVLFVAALNGHTIAGGLELAVACDLRFASDTDTLRIAAPEMLVFGALPSGAGGTQYLVRLMGSSRALEFILRGEPINPRQALEVGLVDRLFANDDLLEGTMSFARTVVEKAGRIGVAAAKSAVFGGDDLPLDQALELDHGVHWDNMRRGNFLAGADSFVARFGG